MECLPKREKMKSLDEVIKALDACLCGAHDRCPYCEDPDVYKCDEAMQSDAYQYLKKLKRIEEKIEKIAIGNVEDTLSKIDNSALTWDELKQMVGNPIWVEEKYHNPDAIYKYWTIVKYFDSHEGEDLIFTGTGFYHRSLLGTGWQAYRKEHHDDNQ